MKICPLNSFSAFAKGLVVLLFAIPGVSLATDYSWTGTGVGGNTTWNNTAAWSPNGTPGVGDNIIGNVATSTRLDVNGNYTINNLTVTTGAWTIGGSGAGRSLTLNTLTTGLSFIMRSTLTVTAAQMNINAGTTSLGAANLALDDLNITTGITLGTNAIVNIYTGSVTGTTYDLGLVTLGNGSQMSLNTGTLAASARTANVSGITGSGTIRTTSSGTNTATLAISNTGTHSSSAVIQDGNATSSLAVTKAGSGTQTFTGSNSFSGGTTITAGTLLVNNTAGSGLGTGSVTVGSGGTLGGTGSISGTTVVSGAIAPGATGIESLDVTNDVTWNAGASWKFELGSGNSSDRLNVTGVGSDFLKGTGSGWSFDFQNTGVFGDTYTLVDWDGSTTFAFGDFSYSNLASGLTGSFAINGTQLDFTVVPEPSTWVLVGVGLISMVVFRRRRASLAKSA